MIKNLLFYFSIVFVFSSIKADIISIQINDYDTCGWFVFKHVNHYNDILDFSNGVSLAIRSVNNGITGEGNASYYFLAFLNDDMYNSDVAYKYHDNLETELFELPPADIYFSITCNNPDTYFNGAKTYPSDLYPADTASYYDFLVNTTSKYTVVPIFERGYLSMTQPYYCFCYESQENIAYVKKVDSSNHVTHLKVQIADVDMEIDTFGDPYVETMLLLWAADGDGDGEFTNDNVHIQSMSAHLVKDVSFQWMPQKNLLLIPYDIADKGYTIGIYNPRGQRIVTLPFLYSPSLNLSSLCAGNYIVNLKNGNGSLLKRIAIIE